MSDAGSHLSSDADDDVSDPDADADEQQRDETADPRPETADIEAAVAQLEESDAHRKKVTAWLTKLTSLAAEARPPAPPAPDERKGSDALRTLRFKVHSVATRHWQQLHVAWLVRNDARKKQLRAARDAQRDWKYVQRDRSEAAKKRRAARELLTAAREKLLPHLTSAELDKLFAVSRLFTSHQAEYDNELDAMWELLLAGDKPPASWDFGNHIEDDPVTGQACVYIGNFRVAEKSAEQRWRGVLVTRWRDNGQLRVDIESGDFAEQLMLERGSCFSYVMAPSD
jgi:hypothetical protein